MQKGLGKGYMLAAACSKKIQLLEQQPLKNIRAARDFFCATRGVFLNSFSSFFPPLDPRNLCC
jgi:hypothetical protein